MLGKNMSSKKILIVDDEPAIIEILGVRLKNIGYEVSSAGDGFEALEQIKKEKPDLIIMDVLMPRMTGFEAMKRIREDPTLRKIPALVISARSGMKDYFSDIIGVQFIAKPYDPNALIARIEIMLGDLSRVPQSDKRVVLAGVEDFLVEKIRAFLSSVHFQIFTALNENDVLSLARDLSPNFVLCQFWEDESVFDAKKLSGEFSGNAALFRIPLYAYCREALSIDAMKTFKGDRLISYNDSSDLLKKLKTFIDEKVFA